MIARRRTDLVLSGEARRDIEKMNTEARAYALDALEDLQAQPKKGEPKNGRLVGAWSWDFYATPTENRPQGRIVYTVKHQEIHVFAVSDGHDEAYSRARSRAARYL
ncbi:type II toxin-antitoxin system RelE family toxin [Holophaga foetida]|uniref:type II toxin-antitoxin system RelE family toxin n=1 Tax=Holophaga foetida TaxID=35839 RepID=UPI00047C1DC6|nr:hypothetical protein [Holophaga foetida]